MRALLVAALLAVGCVSVEATPERVAVRALGQVAVATGCPATARPPLGGTAEAGVGPDPVVRAGSPCVAIQGASISSTMGNAIAALLGLLSASLIP